MVCGADGLPGLILDAAAAEHRAARRRLPTVEEIRSRSENLWKLVDWINAYRAKADLPAVPLSPRLTAVAALHAKDLHENAPHERYGSMHAWSMSERWTGGAFRVGDSRTHPVMWEKPREIAGYDGHGFEVTASGARDPQHALAIWRASRSHNEVILNRGVWRRYRWRALGAVFHQGFACAWFGAKKDA